MSDPSRTDEVPRGSSIFNFLKDGNIQRVKRYTYCRLETFGHPTGIAIHKHNDIRNILLLLLIIIE